VIFSSLVIFDEALLIVFLDVDVESVGPDPPSQQVFKADLFIISVLSVLPHHL
jgi:hypothetical protein